MFSLVMGLMRGNGAKALRRALLVGLLLSLLSGAIMAAAIWRKRDIAHWTEAGKAECRAAVSEAYTRGVDKSLRELDLASEAFSHQLRENERLRRIMNDNIENVRDQMSEAHAAASRLRLACFSKAGQPVEAKVPAEFITQWNRSISLGDIQAKGE